MIHALEILIPEPIVHIKKSVVIMWSVAETIVNFCLNVFVAAGLDPVILLKDYKDPIREGYLSNKFLLNYNEKSEIKDLQDKYDYRLPNSSIDSRSTKMIDDVEKAVPKGLIGNVSIVAKDPAFYRWHRLVNETFNSQVFSDAPNVEIKPCDLCFVFKDELVNVCPGGKKDRWQEYAKKNYAQIQYT
ncbi:16549_t:CDS:2 [Gigaspora margarita]|uniref:16549_t:CDS:1 n=1 Tax=Gigaspora margarita TaxID=4874 RepID=A0ABN7W309_GIGMA|nr:16549_t:CDS:2 [Gigaspora margarita]